MKIVMIFISPYRFPFDEQSCNIELIFTEYNKNEVIWMDLNSTLDASRDTNPAWEFKTSFLEIAEIDVPLLVEGQITNAEKSVFTYTIVLQRQPRTAIVYIILPTVAISIFNLLSLLLPSGEGLPYNYVEYLSSHKYFPAILILENSQFFPIYDLFLAYIKRSQFYY